MSLKDKIESATNSNELFSCLTDEEIAVGNIMADISYAIMAERKKRGLSQKEFAKLLKVSQSLVSKWESCACNFTIESAVSIFSKLGLNVELKINDTSINARTFPFNLNVLNPGSSSKYGVNIAEAV